MIEQRLSAMKETLEDYRSTFRAALREGGIEDARRRMGWIDTVNVFADVILEECVELGWPPRAKFLQHAAEAFQLRVSRVCA